MILNETEEKYVEFQKNVRALRIIAGWSREDMAESLGITTVTYTKIESGTSKMTKLYYLAINKLFDDYYYREFYDHTFGSVYHALIPGFGSNTEELRRLIEISASRVNKGEGIKRMSEIARENVDSYFKAKRKER